MNPLSAVLALVDDGFKTVGGKTDLTSQPRVAAVVGMWQALKRIAPPISSPFLARFAGAKQGIAPCCRMVARPA